MDSWMAYIPSYESTWSLLMNVPHMKVHHPMLSKYLIPSYESSSSYHMKTIIQSYEVTHSILWKALIPSYESHSFHLMNVTHSILWKALIPLDFRHYYGWCPKSPSGMSSLCGKPFKKCFIKNNIKYFKRVLTEQATNSLNSLLFLQKSGVEKL